MNNALNRVVLIALALVASCGAASAARPADGAMYKCSGAAGAPIYQDRPCPQGRELRNFATDPATVSVIPFDQPSPAPLTAKPRESTPAKSARASRDKPVPPRFNASERRHLREGMTQGEVLARLGPPDLKGDAASGTATSSPASATRTDASSSKTRAKGGAKPARSKAGTARARSTKEARWTYLPAPEDAQTTTTITFENGRVARVDRSVVR